MIYLENLQADCENCKKMNKNEIFCLKVKLYMLSAKVDVYAYGIFLNGFFVSFKRRGA